MLSKFIECYRHPIGGDRVNRSALPSTFNLTTEREVMGTRETIERISSDKTTEIADSIGVVGLSAVMKSFTGLVETAKDPERKRLLTCVSYFAGVEVMRQIRRLENAN